MGSVKEVRTVEAMEVRSDQLGQLAEEVRDRRTLVCVGEVSTYDYMNNPGGWTLKGFISAIKRQIRLDDPNVVDVAVVADEQLLTVTITRRGLIPEVYSDHMTDKVWARLNSLDFTGMPFPFTLVLSRED